MQRKLGVLFFALALGGTGCGSNGTGGSPGPGYGYGTGGNGAGGSSSTGGSSSGNGGSSSTGGSSPGTGGTSSTGGSGSGTGGSSAGGSSGTNLDIIVEPSDKGSALTQAIQNAKQSVHMTMYLLSSTEDVNALIAQHQAGHDVKVVLNQNFYSGTGNNAVYTQLKNAGVNVRWAPSGFTYTHEKCVIIDGQVAWIMTMNATYGAPIYNREYLAIDRNPTDVTEADTIFKADYAGQTATVSGPLVVSPVNSRSKIQALVDGAKSTIDIEGEELSDYKLVASLDSALSRGVRVHIVLASGTPTSAQSTAVSDLKSHGAKLVSLATPYIHAKSLVADSTHAYVGSENFTANSFDNNREVGIIFSVAAQVQKVLSTTQSDFSKGTAL